MIPQPTHTTRRRLLAGMVLCALLLTQALGLLHRVVHAHGPALAPHGLHSSVVPAPDLHALDRLFQHHHDAQDCQVFDQLAQADAPGFARVAIPHAPLAEALWAKPVTAKLAVRTAGNLARGPPSQA